MQAVFYGYNYNIAHILVEETPFDILDGPLLDGH